MARGYIFITFKDKSHTSAWLPQYVFVKQTIKTFPNALSVDFQGSWIKQEFGNGDIRDREGGDKWICVHGRKVMFRGGYSTVT